MNQHHNEQQQGGQQGGQQCLQAGLPKGTVMGENLDPAVVSFDEAESALAIKESRRARSHVFVD